MLSPPNEDRNSRFGRNANTRSAEELIDLEMRGATRQTNARAARKGLSPTKKIEEIAENKTKTNYQYDVSRTCSIVFCLVLS